MLAHQTLLDASVIHPQFPILKQSINGKRLVYLDNASSTQKPQNVIHAVNDFYENHYSNIRRGVHTICIRATDMHVEARQKVIRFMNAPSDHSVLFTRGTTEGINLVASSWGRANLKPGDVVICSEMEHHSNLVPWQFICKQTGATLKCAPFDDEGTLDLEALEKMLDENVKMVCVAHVSNTLGTINPIKQIAAMAHRVGALVTVDGAQSAPHVKIDVQDFDVDFMAISGHKMFGPSGIGALYGREELFERMPPYHGGGDMIVKVTFENTTFADLPAKYEAGTPNIEGAIGFGAAVDFMNSVGIDAIAEHEHVLTQAAMERLSEIKGLKLIGTAPNKCSVVSFILDTVHPADIGKFVDTYGVAIRAGHLCSQPCLAHFGLSAVARASFSVYNTMEDIDVLVKAVSKAKEIFG